MSCIIFSKLHSDDSDPRQLMDVVKLWVGAPRLRYELLGTCSRGSSLVTACPSIGSQPNLCLSKEGANGGAQPAVGGSEPDNNACANSGLHMTHC